MEDIGKQLLRDHQGKASTVRVACLACSLTACASVLLPMVGYGETPALGTLTALLGAGFGGKVWQAGIEQRPKTPETGP